MGMVLIALEKLDAAIREELMDEYPQWKGEYVKCLGHDRLP